MKRRYSIRTRSFKFVAVQLMLAAMFLNCACAVAEGPVPYAAMMHSWSAQTAVPAMPQAQQVHTSHVTKTGKTEVGIGFLLLGAGLVTISATALVNSSGFKPSGAKTPALYAGGAGAAAAGVTLIAFGFHKRSAR